MMSVISVVVGTTKEGAVTSTRKNWYYAAGQIWSELTRAAAVGSTPFYEDLASVIGTNPLSVRYALGPIQHFCLAEKLPPLTSIVVQKQTGLPGSGFIAWDVHDLDEAHRRVRAFNWDAVPNPFGNLGPNDDVDSLADELIDTPSASATVYAKVPSRGVAQQVFRAALMKTYAGQCAFCGLSFTEALDAAHILPWAVSDAAQRLDPANGVLVCATHHRLFDASLLTFDESYRIIYCDSSGAEGPYSDADKFTSLGIHGSQLRIPEDRIFRPKLELLAKRNVAGNWGDLSDW